MTRRIGECPGCGAEAVTIRGRGICSGCYWRATHDRQDLPPLINRRSADVVEDVDFLWGSTPENIAQRLGMTLSAIAKAARRQERIDIARMFDAARRREGRPSRATERAA